MNRLYEDEDCSVRSDEKEVGWSCFSSIKSDKAQSAPLFYFTKKPEESDL